jgi:hypothetical protein
MAARLPQVAHATPRQRFIAALERRPLAGRVPHFELVFFLTMETFGKVHPSHRHYGQCVYTGMELRRYELIRHVWRIEGIRSEPVCQN